jgi:hypothetical protein
MKRERACDMAAKFHNFAFGVVMNLNKIDDRELNKRIQAAVSELSSVEEYLKTKLEK